jgi:cathepsin B
VAICQAILPQKGDNTNVALHEIAVTKDLVNQINSVPNLSWKASTEQGSLISGATLGFVKSLLGVRPGGPKLPRKTEFEVKVEDLPDTFDSRLNWPQCLTMKVVRDQSACGTCWAFGAAEAISDRYCTYGIDNNMSVASGDIGFCCGFDCGDGCDGGYPSSAWEYWVDSGVVDESCYPYPFPSCDHHVPNSKNPCPSDEYPTPNCPSKCNNGKTWSDSKHYGSTAFSISGETQIMQEIFKNGPVETSFSVYQDFLTYKTGVYQRKSNNYLGGHAVKFVGWGVEGGVKYWLVANSWNPSWGDGGYFKIIKGKDECGIEDSVNAGVPKK